MCVDADFTPTKTLVGHSTATVSPSPSNTCLDNKSDEIYCSLSVLSKIVGWIVNGGTRPVHNNSGTNHQSLMRK